MEIISIGPANTSEGYWAADLMASSEPWVSLGISFEALLEACSHPEYQLYVARSEQGPEGAVLIHPRGLAGSPYIKSFVVRQNSRNNKVGEQLLKFVEETFVEQSPNLFLCVSSFNVGAQRFYLRNGFSQVGEFRDYLLKGASELLYYKKTRL